MPPWPRSCPMPERWTRWAKLRRPGVLSGQGSLAIDAATGGVLKGFHVPPKAKRVISLFMSGGPSQLDLFDYKPLLNTMNGKDLPDSVRMGQRLTGMSANQATLPMAGSIFKFANMASPGRGSASSCRIRRESSTSFASIKSLYTEAINHDPAITFFQTGRDDRRPAIDGVVAQLWPGLDQPEPADVLRLDQPEAA